MIVVSIFADDMYDVFLKKGSVFTKADKEMLDFERRTQQYKALFGTTGLLCMMAICNAM